MATSLSNVVMSNLDDGSANELRSAFASVPSGGTVTTALSGTNDLIQLATSSAIAVSSTYAIDVSGDGMVTIAGASSGTGPIFSGTGSLDIATGTLALEGDISGFTGTISIESGSTIDLTEATGFALVGTEAHFAVEGGTVILNKASFPHSYTVDLADLTLGSTVEIADLADGQVSFTANGLTAGSLEFSATGVCDLLVVGNTNLVGLALEVSSDTGTTAVVGAVAQAVGGEGFIGNLFETSSVDTFSFIRTTLTLSEAEGQSETIAASLSSSVSNSSLDFLVQDGPGRLYLTDALQDFYGAVSVEGGTLVITAESGGVTETKASFSVEAGGTLDFDISGSGGENIDGSLSGLGTIEKDGVYTLYLSGDASSFTGTLEIDEGMVDLSGEDLVAIINKTTVVPPAHIGLGQAGAVLALDADQAVDVTLAQIASGSGLVFKDVSDSGFDSLSENGSILTLTEPVSGKSVDIGGGSFNGSFFLRDEGIHKAEIVAGASVISSRLAVGFSNYGPITNFAFDQRLDVTDGNLSQVSVSQPSTNNIGTAFGILVDGVQQASVNLSGPLPSGVVLTTISDFQGGTFIAPAAEVTTSSFDSSGGLQQAVTTVGDNGVVQLDGNLNITGSCDLVLPSGTLTFKDDGNDTIAGAVGSTLFFDGTLHDGVSTNAGIVKDGAGTLALQGDLSNFTGTITIAGGTLDLTQATLHGTLTFSDFIDGTNVALESCSTELKVDSIGAQSLVVRGAVVGATIDVTDLAPYSSAPQGLIAAVPVLQPTPFSLPVRAGLVHGVLPSLQSLDITLLPPRDVVGAVLTATGTAQIPGTLLTVSATAVQTGTDLTFSSGLQDIFGGVVQSSSDLISLPSVGDSIKVDEVVGQGTILTANLTGEVINAALSGSGTLIQDGPGALALNGSLAKFNGTLDLDGGALDITETDTLAAAGKISLGFGSSPTRASLTLASTFEALKGQDILGVHEGLASGNDKLVLTDLSATDNVTATEVTNVGTVVTVADQNGATLSTFTLSQVNAQLATTPLTQDGIFGGWDLNFEAAPPPPVFVSVTGSTFFDAAVSALNGTAGTLSIETQLGSAASAADAIANNAIASGDTVTLPAGTTIFTPDGTVFLNDTSNPVRTFYDIAAGLTVTNGGFIKSGPGVLALSGTEAVSGVVSILGGTLDISGATGPSNFALTGEDVVLAGLASTAGTTGSLANVAVANFGLGDSVDVENMAHASKVTAVSIAGTGSTDLKITDNETGATITIKGAGAVATSGASGTFAALSDGHGGTNIVPTIDVTSAVNGVADDGTGTLANSFSKALSVANTAGVPGTVVEFLTQHTSSGSAANLVVDLSGPLALPTHFVHLDTAGNNVTIHGAGGALTGNNLFKSGHGTLTFDTANTGLGGPMSIGGGTLDVEAAIASASSLDMVLSNVTLEGPSSVLSNITTLFNLAPGDVIDVTDASPTDAVASGGNGSPLLLDWMNAGALSSLFFSTTTGLAPFRPLAVSDGANGTDFVMAWQVNTAADATDAAGGATMSLRDAMSQIEDPGSDEGIIAFAPGINSAPIVATSEEPALSHNVTLFVDSGPATIDGHTVVPSSSPTGTATLIKDGAGFLDLHGASFSTQHVEVRNGTLQLEATSTTTTSVDTGTIVTIDGAGTLVLDDATATTTTTDQPSISLSGSGSLVKSGLGELLIPSTANDSGFTGAVFVQGALLEIDGQIGSKQFNLTGDSVTLDASSSVLNTSNVRGLTGSGNAIEVSDLDSTKPVTVTFSNATGSLSVQGTKTAAAGGGSASMTLTLGDQAIGNVLNFTTVAGSASNPGLLVQLAAATGTPLITNGNFQTGDFTGWSAITSGIISAFTAPFSDGQNTPATNAGTAWFVRDQPSNYPALSTEFLPISDMTAVNGFDGFVSSTGGDYDLVQNFTIPTGSTISNVNLSFTYGVQALYGPAAVAANLISSAASFQQRTFDVYILDHTGTTTLGHLYDFAVPFSQPWTTTQVALDVTSLVSGLGAGTYALEFNEHVPESHTGPAEFGIDNISLTGTIRTLVTPPPGVSGGGGAPPHTTITDASSLTGSAQVNLAAANTTELNLPSSSGTPLDLANVLFSVGAGNTSPVVLFDTAGSANVTLPSVLPDNGQPLTFVASTGNNSIIGGAVPVNIFGGSGNDIIALGSGGGLAIGGTGHATITGGSGGTGFGDPNASLIIGASGGGSITAGGNGAIVVGGGGSETIAAGAGLNVSGGQQFLVGARSDPNAHDVISVPGGAAGASLFALAGAGTTTFTSSGAEQDVIVGGSGNLNVTAGTGPLLMIGANSTSTTLANAAVTNVTTGNASSAVIFDPIVSTTTPTLNAALSVSGGSGMLTVVGSAANHAGMTVTGAAGLALISGDGGSDLITLGPGGGTILGGTGGGVLAAGLGGSNVVAGGGLFSASAASDTFQIQQALGGGSAVEIAGFRPGTDHLDLSAFGLNSGSTSLPIGTQVTLTVSGGTAQALDITVPGSGSGVQHIEIIGLSALTAANLVSLV